MRNFDVGQQFNEIKTAAADAVKTVFPIEGKIRNMELSKVWVEDTVRVTDYAGQAKTKGRGGTWGIPVYANLVLKEKSTGKVLDKSSKVKLFTLPKPTDRFSYIVGGNEYQVPNQLRLKPGVYTLRKQNGELKTQVNLAKGKNFELNFKEKTGQFTISKIGGGQANIPLYPILLHLGISHSAIANSWGDRVAGANKSSDPKAVQRAATAFKLRKGELKDYLNETELDPKTTKITLGKGYDKVDGPMLLSASKKLLDVHLGKQEPEDRDSLEFKDLHSLEDFIKERLEKNKNTLAWKIRRSIDSPKRTKISQIVNPGAFNSVIESFFTQDDKSATPEQTNPLEMLSGQYRATIMGSGGIRSDHAVTPEMREVHPTHYGFLDPIHTPESRKIGASLNIPLGVLKDGKEIKVVVQKKDGKSTTLNPTQAFNATIALPGQNMKKAKIKAMHKGKTVEVGPSQVDYITPSPRGLFSWSSNLVPFLPTNQGNRAMMAAKMMEQAISLKDREAPLVQVGATPNATFERVIGQSLVKKAPINGVVTKVEPDAITIRTKDGKTTKTEKVDLYNNFPLNRKSFLHHESTVKVGDKVKAGQTIAESNYTKSGTLALGTNLKTAYIPYGGLNFEDGVVITETAAKKLTSEHIHRKALSIDDSIIMNITAFRNTYPNALTSANLKKLDNTGVIKKGETIEMGEAVIAALRRRDPSKALGLIKKQLADRPSDKSVYWKFEDTGRVIDVQRSGKEVTVLIQTEEGAKIGDKLAGRHGNKGIITKIIPDGESPKDKNGDPVEIMLNPHGVISRINVGQMYESAAAKTAKKTGKPFVVNNFSGENYLNTIKSLIKNTGVNDKEELFDAKTGKSLGKVHVGNPHILKLFKQSTGNFSVRQGGPGQPYDLNQQPLKAGGEESSKSLDLLTYYSMLSHGARANLKEMSSIKANQNDEFWKALKSGQMLPTPQAPFVYDKFINYLKASGIDVRKSGSKLTLAPFTDEEVDEVSVGEIKKPIFYRGKDMTPLKGGFFDPQKLGGFRGTKWGHLELKEPVVNPVFETAIKKITGLGKKYDKIVAGELYYNPKTEEFSSDGKGLTGGKAIEAILKKIDMDKEIASLTKRAVKAKGNTLDDINKKLRYLTALKKLNLKPDKAYIRKKVPVIPPVYRPLYSLPDGNITTSDVNVIYQNLGVLNEMQKLPVMDLLPDQEKASLRKDINEHMRGVSGLVDLPIRGRERSGFISEIKGGAKGPPKEGFFIRKVLSKRQDYVGRGTIIPEPDLGIDEVALPETMAWKLFEPFVIREMGKFGKTPLQGIQEIKERTELAQKALEIVMRERKIMLKRDPALHKFSIMAFKPKITNGTAIKIPPLVVKGFNADFDGDTMMVHVPVTDEGNKEADKMMPSKNLYQPGTGKLMISPSQEAQIGIFYLSKSAGGRKILNKILPKKHSVKAILDKKETSKLLTKLSKELNSNDFGKVITRLKTQGEQHAYEKGFTLGIEDLAVLGKNRDAFVDGVAKLTKKKKTQEGLNALNTSATRKIDEAISRRLKGKNNPLFDMVDSGARGSADQLRGILATPLFVTDARGRVVPSPIKKSYSEGLDVGDYWTSLYGARRGMMDRALSTSKPGEFSKTIMASTIDNVIAGADCGTKDGVDLSISDPDVVDRYLAGSQAGLSHNTIVDNRTISRLKKSGKRTVKVRSPLTCELPKGVCKKCYGVDEFGGDPEIGDNIGAKAGQSISEPLVQMVMNTFHTGGAAGTGSDVVGYKRIDQLLKLPKIVAGAAPLSPKDGRVTDIKKGIAGGYDVHIGTDKIHVPQGRKLKVRVGANVGSGDPLSDGVIKPQDLVKYKGMRPTQDYLVNELKNAYSKQGVNIHRKVFETIVRSTANTTQVLNNPNSSSYLPGDTIPYTVALHHNRNLVTKMPTEEAVGLKLNKGKGPFRKGHILEAKDVKLLTALGQKEVEVIRDPIVHTPTVKTINTLPMLKKNWMAALGFRNLAKALTEGAGQSWTTDLEDHHPIPAFAHGAKFGMGTEGKY